MTRMDQQAESAAVQVRVQEQPQEGDEQPENASGADSETPSGVLETHSQETAGGELPHASQTLLAASTANATLTTPTPQNDDYERLDDKLQRGALELEEVVSIVRYLATRLDTMHAVGQTDGALVPTRIALHRDGRIEVLPASEAHRINKAYTAPEAWTAPSTPASDQYALAAVLYEALCGGRAFPGETTERIRVSVTTGSRVPLAARVPGLAFAIDDVFSQALSLEPAQRFANCTEFAERLVEAFDNSRPSQGGNILVAKPSLRVRSSTDDDFDGAGAEKSAQAPWVRVLLAIVLLAIAAAILALRTK